MSNGAEYHLFASLEVEATVDVIDTSMLHSIMRKRSCE